MPSPATLPDHGSIRADHPAFTDITYLDTSSMGLMAQSTVHAAQREHERLMR